ncbi:predicted protein [Histoplasma capsulatum var. duboisii H88]|uniref:Predicted protein n=1 Tax=Ajellomyces capsulatus (strain H88) TaxID=544711 RepID=F0UBZ8_AJEC8|nr:predicted protein [Histoplasma capsulatum var. duboisii H88]
MGSRCAGFAAPHSEIGKEAILCRCVVVSASFLSLLKCIPVWSLLDYDSFLTSPRLSAPQWNVSTTQPQLGKSVALHKSCCKIMLFETQDTAKQTQTQSATTDSFSCAGQLGRRNKPWGGGEPISVVTGKP